eukprot:m.35589 g.35589  ORF g.35589 m.35589 type:complete len:299 (-) comp12404_c0_seq1:55-951(-)
MWSFHSHSGQFCKHAAGTLEEMVLQAIKLGFTHYGLSEHMPRYRGIDLYPEELEAGMGPEELEEQFASYVVEARRLQTLYRSKIQLFVGVETELCRPESLADVSALQAKYALDYMVGSVHHVDGIPIDFDEARIQRAETACGGAEALALRYFDHVTTMIETLQPDVVGHLDLIRLLRPNLEMNLNVMAAVEKAVMAGVRYGCVFEINSAGLRKGLQGPYPHADVLKVLQKHGAKLCISDDAHKPEQVGTCYQQLRAYLVEQNVTSLWFLNQSETALAWSETQLSDSDGKWALFASQSS